MSEVETRGRAPRGAVVLAEPTLLAHVEDPETDPFRAGSFVGSLMFSGGYITEAGPFGMQNISARVERGGQDRVRELATDALREALDSACGDCAWADLPSPAPRRRKLPGTYAEEGRDNLALPRFRLEPASLDPAALAHLPEADIVVVPLIVACYTHNGGWFPGQTWGTTAGARFRVLITSYDARAGQALAWSEIDVRYLDPEESSPNSSQVEQYLLEVFDLIGKPVRRKGPVRW